MGEEIVIHKIDDLKVPTVEPSAQLSAYNPQYARDAQMVAVPLTTVESVSSLHEIIGYPLLAPAIKLNSKAGLRTVDSSVWERREDGFYAYLALKDAEIPPHWKSTIDRLCVEDDGKDPLEGRFIKRKLPSFSAVIPGVYLEVKIGQNTSANEVEEVLMGLVSRLRLSL